MLKTPIGAVLLFLALAATAHADPAPPPRAAHVIIVGVDGMSTDGVQKADTPVMHDMMKHGSWTLHARGVLPTTSAPNWASMLNGVGPELHGVTSNDWQAGDFGLPVSVIGSGSFFPSIFQILADQHPDWELGSVYQWEGFGNLYDHRFVRYDILGRDEDETTALATTYIKAKRPAFLFMHLDLVDDAGHTYGHGSPNYYAAVAKADRLIGQVRRAVTDAGIADDTVILVTADHGGVGKGHGGQSLAELEIPWIISGKGIVPDNRLDFPVNTFDTPATVAWLLGAKVPYAWLGRPVTPAVMGEKVPDQMYRLASFHAAPRIEPANDGATDAGGLFIDQPVQVTIRNPDATGEIRYTLDNAIPTAQSPRYSGPITLTHSTIVRAALFVDGKPASSPAKGYFRILEQKGHDTRGVGYKVYLLPDPSVRLPDFSRLSPVATGTAHEFSLSGLTLPRQDNVAVVFEGFIRIPAAGDFSFVLASDDGSKLLIDGKVVVDNDGSHGVVPANGSVTLAPGRHAIRVEWFNGGGGASLNAYFEGPGVPRQIIDPNLLDAR